MVMPYTYAAMQPMLGGFFGGAGYVPPTPQQQRLQAIGALLSGLGGGLLSGRNLGQGLGLGIQAGTQGLQQAREDQQRQAQFGMQQQQFQQQQAELQRQEAQRQAQLKAQAGVTLPGVDAATSANLLTAYPALGAESYKARLTPQAPYSSIGKLQADLAAGRISPTDYATALKKETYISYPQAPQISPSDITGPLLQKMSRGQTLTPAERQALDYWRDTDPIREMMRQVLPGGAPPAGTAAGPPTGQPNTGAAADVAAGNLYGKGASAADPVAVSSPEEAAKLPSGTYFRTPDGRIIRKH